MGKQAAKQRLIGVVVPVGALRGAESIGVGEFPDLIAFGQLCKKIGIGLIQVLPVNDTGYESSPYSALSAFALHPLYMRIAALPEAQTPAAKGKLADIKQRFEQDVRFKHYHLLKAKLELLHELYTANEAKIRDEAQPGGPLAAWIQRNPWVKEYAIYRRLKQANGERSWKDWSSHQQVSHEEIEALWNDDALKSEQLFWVWLQKGLDAQFSEVAASLAKAGILLEGDLPILINEDSCDAWAYPEYFNLELSAGAPPDMYSPNGQNWGFPTYNWEALAQDDYSWWRKRLEAAAKYYKAYRIDHVLGFFRIWASSRHDKDDNSTLGRFVPYTAITEQDLIAQGFDAGRIRWLSRPHLPTGEIWKSLESDGHLDAGAVTYEAERACTLALDRLDNEPLWLFKDTIRGEKDIEALQIHPAVKNYLLSAWGQRLFLEYKRGSYVPVWRFRESRAYLSLSDAERWELEAMLERKRHDSEATWEKQGEKLLTVLTESSDMLPCAEDLGAVPECVPRVLAKLNILGLRVVRWFRAWDRDGQPYIPLQDYPELSVCTPAVHDSSTLREWWEREADQNCFTNFIGQPFLSPRYNPGVAKIVLGRLAASASRFRVFQVQDLLHLSPRWYADDPASERINVPGSCNEFNWTYRLPATIEELAKDADFTRSVEELSHIPPIEKK
ncbi:MAG: 4-alpha-glucanotransferase [Treponema sp.]|jgi:4-alpha-glucanotransferase|nr:4-alpha-glucanotransferase [Treponema sp.]